MTCRKRCDYWCSQPQGCNFVNSTTVEPDQPCAPDPLVCRTGSNTFIQEVPFGTCCNAWSGFELTVSGLCCGGRNDCCQVECDCTGTGGVSIALDPVACRAAQPDPISCDDWWARKSFCQRQLRPKLSKARAFIEGSSDCDQEECAQLINYGACCEPKDGLNCKLIDEASCKDPFVHCVIDNIAPQNILPWDVNRGEPGGIPSPGKDCKCKNNSPIPENTEFGFNECVGRVVNNQWEGCRINACCLEDCCEELPIVECVARGGTPRIGQGCHQLPCTHFPVSNWRCQTLPNVFQLDESEDFITRTEDPVSLDDSTTGCGCKHYAPDIVRLKSGFGAGDFGASICHELNVNFEDPFKVRQAGLWYELDENKDFRINGLINELNRCRACQSLF